MAEEPVGAFIEAFQEHGILIAGAEVDRRSISILTVPTDLMLADCTASRSRAFGLTGEIHSSANRRQTQRWAAAFRAAGFDGTRFLVCHDPGQRQVGFAIFGKAGEAPWAIRSTHRIDADLVLDVERRFGIRVQH